VPLARANPEACERLVAAIAGKGPTNRQIGQLYAAWRDGLPAIRERVLTAPLLLLKARQAIGTVPEDEGRLVMDDLDMLAAIARALQVSRAAVRDVLRRGSAEVPRLTRPEKALEHREEILRLLRECEGSFMRVHEELTKAGLPLSYPALTAFCRRHGIGQAPK